MRKTLTSADVRRGLVMIEGGKGGEPIPMVLNSDQRAAFSALLAVTGKWDATKYARLVRAAGWPKGVRPYNAQHAVGIELAERGAEDAHIQAQLGHSDVAMVRARYMGIRVSKMRRISKLLEGRLGWKNAPSHTPSHGTDKKRKDAKRRGHSRMKTSA